MIQLSTVRVDLRGIIGTVHQVVEVGYPRVAQRGQGNGNLAVVGGGGGQEAADRDAAIGGDSMCSL